MKNHLHKFITFLIIVLAINLSPFKLIIVQGLSMYPSLKDKQILIAIRTNNVNKNDVVVAYVEDSYIIKRVAYVAGDEIFYLFTNNSEIPIIINKELYEKHKKNEKTASVQKIKIDKDKVFLLGDNSELSDDSRRFGCLNTDTIKYKIILPRL